MLFEFYCTECSKYFDVKLNVALSGNYRIHCPECGHVHFRKVSGGNITDVRFPDNHESILIEDIRPMKACSREFRTEKVGRDPLLDDSWRSKLDVVEAQ